MDTLRLEIQINIDLATPDHTVFQDTCSTPTLFGIIGSILGTTADLSRSKCLSHKSQVFYKMSNLKAVLNKKLSNLVSHILIS